jgi:HPt (histidine-containing phosphotransfer) domain-containing protein
MTAGAFKDDRERCLNAGMDAYLSKPIRPATLYEMIDAMTLPSNAEQGSVQAESIMDWNAALEQIGGSEDLLRELMELFLEESGKLMPALRQAVEQRNMADVRRLAHTVKGAATHFTAHSVVAAALRLETMGRDGDLAGADEAYARLEREVEQLKQALGDFAQS